MSGIGRSVSRVARSEFVTNYLRRRIAGNIDRCAEGRIAGWICLRRKPEALTVDIDINGVAVARNLLANLVRNDVRDAGYGSGAFGFDVAVPIEAVVADSVERSIEVRLSDTGKVALKRSFAPQATQSVPSHSEEVQPHRQVLAGALDPVTDGLVRGWSVNENDRGSIYSATVLLDGVPFGTLQNDRPRNDLLQKGISNGLGGFSLQLPEHALEAGLHKVRVVLPDGTQLAQDFTLPPRPVHVSATTEAAWDTPLTVIVPVYNAVEDLEICIQRLRDHTPADVSILLINDASPDPRIAPVLAAATELPGFKVLQNTKNLGFSGTINRGIAECPGHDVILLNSDARVTPGWTEGLRLAAYSGPRIATATAMSDRAGAFSAPEIGNANELPEGVDEITFARAVRRNSLGLYPRVPTGNGFCMFIRRACIDQIGALDAEAFPRGYGEENDFCMRALRAGWRHVIDDRTYVFHDRSKSFGGSKDDLITAGRAVVDQRYPEYKSAISIFASDPKIALARFRVRAVEAGRARTGALTRILFVIATQTGGTPQTNRDLMSALDGDIEGWSMRCDSTMIELNRIEDGKELTVLRHQLQEPLDPLTHRSVEYDAVVTQILLACDFDLVHIRHLAWHSLSLPRIVKRMGRPVVFSFHDFYMVSPTVKLLDDDGVFLGDSYSEQGRALRQDLWPKHQQPQPTGDWLAEWQERNQEALSWCDAFVTTSESARDIILERLPRIPADRFKVIRHGRDFPEFQRLAQPYLQHDRPIRILVPGNIDISKGLNVLYALAEHDKAGLIEFHILGRAATWGKPLPRGIILHPAYERNEFAAKVAPLRPQIGAVFSIWDETWCHTLTEMWSVGIPVAVFDMPTVAERVRRSGAGWVFDHKDIAQLYQDLVRVCTDPVEWQNKQTAIAHWQTTTGIANTNRAMAAQYLAIYRDLIRKAPVTPGSGTLARVAVICPANSDLERANASTHIRIWERTRNHIARDISYIRMTPETALAAARLKRIDAAIIQRTALPKTIAGAVLDALQQNDIPFVFELDDDLLSVPADKDPTGVYTDYAPITHRLLAEAGAVTVSTQPLADAMKAHAKRVELVPNRLSGRLFPTTPIPRRPDQEIRAVYMGTKTHEADLRLILPALDAVAAQNPAFRLSLIGISDNPELLDGRGGWIERRAIPDTTKSYPEFTAWLAEQATDFDFALAPLEDQKFNQTKSALKLLDYAALGLPIIVSQHLIYTELARQIPHVIAANTTAKWTNAIKEQIRKGHRPASVSADMMGWVRRNAFLADGPDGIDDILISLQKGK